MKIHKIEKSLLCFVNRGSSYYFESKLNDGIALGLWYRLMQRHRSRRHSAGNRTVGNGCRMLSEWGPVSGF